MSRGDELRQLAAQLSVLAALEDSIAVGLSRVMGPASPALVVEHVVLEHVDADAAHVLLATFPQDVVFERFVEHVDVSQFFPRYMDLALFWLLFPLVTWHRGSSTGQS